jgi:hypothetical protein
MNSEVFTENDLKVATKELLKNIKNLLKEVDSVVLTDSKTGLSLLTKYQFMFGWKPRSLLQARLYELILRLAVDAEKLGPGSFDRVLERLSEHPNNLTNDYSDDFDNKGLSTVPASLADLKTFTEDYFKSAGERAHHIFLEALDLAGFGGKIVVEKTHAGVPSVELTHGYAFDVKPAWDVNLKLENTRIFVIDGYVESVSEIHHLLESQAVKKENSVIFLRGMSQDVIHTLRVNFDRGTLTAIPVIVNFDIEGINTLNDVAIITGCDVVSSNKGNLISSIDYNSATIVESVTLYPSKVVIQHKKTSLSIATHVNFLKNKRMEKSAVEDMGKLYDKRIRSLTPNQVIIRLSDDKDFIKTSQSIDLALRTVKSLIEYGVSTKNKLPAMTEFSTQKYLRYCVETLSNLGAIICA